MGFFNKLKEKKNEYDKVRTSKQVAKLRQLREDRIKLEGKSRLVDYEKKERDRIAKAKKNIKSNSKIGRLTSKFSDSVSSGIRKKLSSGKRVNLVNKSNSKNDTFGFVSLTSNSNDKKNKEDFLRW